MFTKLLPRFANAEIDDNREKSLLALNTVGGATLPIHGLALSGVNALVTAIVDGNGNQITASNPLAVTATITPSGTQDTNLKQVGNATFALGQQLAASSLPIVLTAAQITTLTPPAAITGYALDATLTGGTQQTKITDGTNIVSTLKSDGSAAGQNALMVATATQTLSFTTSTPGAQILLANTPVGNYTWVEIMYTSVGSGLAGTVQVSNASGGTYGNLQYFSSNLGAIPAANSGVVVNTIYSAPIRGNFLQLNITGLTSGTVTGTVTFKTLAPPSATVSAGQNGTWTVGANSPTGSAVPANAFYTGFNNASGNLTGWGVVSADGITSVPGVSLETFNGTNMDRLRSIINATNSIGTGIIAAGMLAQLDDTSPTTITENQFGNMRMAADRSLLVANRATTPAQSSVGSSASNVNLLASNASRKGTTIFNDSTQVLYLKLGTTASTTSYSVQIASNGYYEVPFGYIGNIDGIWASANGNARISEFT